MLAILAFVAFLVAAIRDLFATAPTHQFAVLTIGLALLALHMAWPMPLRQPTQRP